MSCPECERLRSVTDGAAAAEGAQAGAEGDAVRCERCTQDAASAAALLRLLTQLANCGLTAEAPPILHPMSSRT